MSKKRKGNDNIFVSNLLRTWLPTITTLHGTNQLSILSGRRLILWRLLVLLNTILTIAFVVVIKNRFNSDQILTRISNKCQLNETPFPAVSICNFNKVSLRESQSIIQILKEHNFSEADIPHFLHNLQHLRDYSYLVQNISYCTEIMSVLKNHYFTVESIMEEVLQKCDKLLLHCTFNRQVKNCGDIFTLVKTYDGHCCTFNYAALNDDSKGSMSAKDEDMEYYEDPGGEDATTNQPIIVTSESGRGSGLSVILNVEPNDYPEWSGVPYYGAKILINDPNDYPEITVSYRFVSLRESLDIKVQPLVFQCEEDIRKVSPEKRACWFHDEILLQYTDRYSYETCLTECKMKTFLNYCGCVPYKYPIMRSTPICEFHNLGCLNNVTSYMTEQTRACDPVCYMECWDKRYSVTSDITPFVPELFPASVIKGHNVSELSALQVYYAKSTCNSYKLMLLMDLNYFIATYGGIFSLCFGVSLLTIWELVYLLLAFLFKLLLQNHNKLNLT